MYEYRCEILISSLTEKMVVPLFSEDDQSVCPDLEVMSLNLSYHRQKGRVLALTLIVLSSKCKLVQLWRNCKSYLTACSILQTYSIKKGKLDGGSVAS